METDVLARAIRGIGQYLSHPYWIYDGSVRVERSVPMIPFRKEVTHLALLEQSYHLPLSIQATQTGRPSQLSPLDCRWRHRDAHAP